MRNSFSCPRPCFLMDRLAIAMGGFSVKHSCHRFRHEANNDLRRIFNFPDRANFPADDLLQQPAPRIAVSAFLE